MQQLTIEPKGLSAILTRRAVAILALGWRLRVELAAIRRFGRINSVVHISGLIGQSPLPRLNDQLRPLSALSLIGPDRR